MPGWFTKDINLTMHVMSPVQHSSSGLLVSLQVMTLSVNSPFLFYNQPFHWTIWNSHSILNELPDILSLLSEQPQHLLACPWRQCRDCLCPLDVVGRNMSSSHPSTVSRPTILPSSKSLYCLGSYPTLHSCHLFTSWSLCPIQQRL